jgi:UDP-hydrolysing UDP-N-acetyl-D-glucosamine 2-epimerase
LQAEKKFKTEVIVSGHHFNKKQGLSLNEIKKSKVKNVILSRSYLKNTSTLLVSLYSSKIVKDFTFLYKQYKPNMVIVLGDRYEILSSILPLIFFKIPIIHFNGGEKTSGSFDDQIRHIITKISDYHFVANKEYKNRVIQLGENPKNIFNFGGISNFIDKKNLLSKSEIIKKLNLNPSLKIVLSTFHPETNKSKKYNIDAFKILVDCLLNLKKKNIVLTYPNLDPGSSDLTNILNKLEKKKI